MGSEKLTDLLWEAEPTISRQGNLIVLDCPDGTITDEIYEALEAACYAESPIEKIVELEKELGVKGTAAVFRASLALAKKAVNEARRSALSTKTKGEGHE